MNYRLSTRYDEMCLVIKVAVQQPCVVRIKIYDEKKPKTVFTDRYKTVKTTEIFHIRLPLTPESIIISIYDDNKGNTPRDQEKNIRLVSMDKAPLEKRLDVVDIRNASVNNFVDFAQRFSFNSAYIEPNKTYESDNGRFLIEYMPKIIGSNGKELTTPARISRVNGRIQVSKKHFDTYTVPMRFAILCHEFSHFYLNENMDDETEADINGLLIYLGLGYPRIEGYRAFLEVFKDAPNEGNKNRYDKIDKFIRDFEKNKMVLR